MVCAPMDPDDIEFRVDYPVLDTPARSYRRRLIHPENPAVLVRDFKTEKTFIITRSDIMRVLM